MPTMLAFAAVELGYASGRGVGPLTFELAPQQVTALVGPSGCGKSTVLRLAAGLLTPSAGRVSLAGETLTARNVLGMRRRLGYVQQEGGLFPHLSAAENVTLMARHLGWDAPRIEHRLHELVGLVQLPREFLDRHPAQLSGGERQRVSLARALMLDPDLLLLDEPLGALDPVVRHELQRELRALVRRLGKAVLFVTHDVAEAGYVADDLMVMRSGRLVQRGSLRDLLRSPVDESVTRFLGAQRQIADVLAESP
jgi:osmoprotectant transport system ATP-binding protein